MKRGVRIALGAALLASALGLGAVSMQRVERQLASTRICEAATASDWDGALALADTAPRRGPEAQLAAECLCWAWSARERVGDCAEHLDALLSEDATWLPEPGLLRLVLRMRVGQGRHAEAAALARRATGAHPDDPALLDLELTSRAASEGEAAVLSALAARVRAADAAASGPRPGSVEQRLVLAAAYDRQADYASVLAMLGDTPPPADHPAHERWFEARASALGSRGDTDALRAHYARWAEHGADPVELAARYALRLSQFGLRDLRFSREQLLRAVIANEGALERQDILRTAYERLIGRLVIDKRGDEALELWDRAAERFDDLVISRAEVLRAAQAGALAPSAAGGRGETLRFAFAGDAPAGELLVSPAHDAPPDAPWEVHAVAAGAKLEVERALTAHPQRWVYRDGLGRTRGSGTVWPEPGGATIEVAARAPRTPPTFTPQRRPGDGRERVFVVIPDCEDWRLQQYLRQRGELPVHDWLYDHGWSAVVHSAPPFTGAAMEALVRPDADRRVTLAGVANRLGVEVAGLASVGRNPLRFLAPWLPAGNDLFESVGSGEHVALNLLFTHGHIDAGRHAELIGPHGLRSDAPLLRASRPLTPVEKADLPDALTEPRYRAEVRKLAAALDSALDLARGDAVDLVMLRLEPVDILTHGFYSELVRSGQDDGAASLLWVYRYLDQRLGELLNTLDADDTLVWMSDHGIRTALEHEEDAIFVAVGPDVPVGRAEGMPHLRGVPRVVAALLGLERRDWPDTGLAPWLNATASR